MDWLKFSDWFNVWLNVHFDSHSTTFSTHLLQKIKLKKVQNGYAKVCSRIKTINNLLLIAGNFWLSPIKPFTILVNDSMNHGPWLMTLHDSYDSTTLYNYNNIYYTVLYKNFCLVSYELYEIGRIWTWKWREYEFLISDTVSFTNIISVWKGCYLALQLFYCW